ncbi:Aldehyde dehydrogenase [Candidatus Rhodobacter oscarellae]|uniref:Aldehyde dehydrogenase n=1 Tax=Candidatus Rhodobacter oscarellae TaxID=1675527 RepID=A0A0J9E205_9RHOB|nr:tubulin-like doman-containing protein [Candidatus Rhodobacter lobularis]KMW56901.1 Aldehyde dehydrogenase [Candidatus Rhodobacter lobularis]
MVDQSFRPTVLIGVGGTGCRIAERVYRRALTQETGLSGKLAVLGFDTDLNDMNKLKAIEPSNRFRFSSKDRIRDYIHKHHALTADFMVDENTLPQRFLNKSLIEGAGQIRMLSHMGFFTAQASKSMEQQVSNVFSSLARMDNTENFQGFINVMMVGSIAGATGSGSFIQIAMMLKQAARNIEIDIRGIFLMPDVYTNAANLPVDQIPNVKGGGYAALKELNAVNVLAEGKQKNLNFKYEYAPDQFIGTSNFPFESVTLIDFESVDGRSLGRSLPSYITMCERAVYQQIFSPIGGRMRSIEVNDTRALLFAAAEGIHNIYSGVGLSSIIYPSEHNGSYLTYRFALEMLSGDWTRLDKQYNEKVRNYQQQRAAGNVLSAEPRKRDSYLEDLDRLAKSERSAFFVAINENLNPKIEDERGNVREVSMPTEFLKALLAKVSVDFWDSKDLNGAGTKANIVPETLGNPASLAGDVKDLERGLDRDLAKLDEVLRDKPRDILTNSLSFADTLGQAQWADHHIQSHIVKNGPHVVQVRAFLYRLQQLIEERLEGLDPSEQRQKLFRFANVFEEEPDKTRSQRGTAGVLEKATEAVKGKGIGKLIGRNQTGAFVEEYVTYYNNSLKAMRRFAEEAIELGMLRELRKEIDALEEIVTGVFTEIESLIVELEKACTEQEHTYDSLASLDGNYWVYGSSKAKQALWETMSERVAGVGDEAGMNESLTDAIYRKYRLDKKNVNAEEPTNIRQLFQDTVIDGYARQRVTQENKSVYDMTVVQAVQNEAALMGEDWRIKLRDIVRVVSAQSTPLLGIKDPSRNGQRIMFWSVNPLLEQQINDPAMFQEMFTLNQGEAPVVLEEFSVQELTCVNTLVNLDLNQLSKLSTQDIVMGIPGNKGSYYVEYEKMIEGLIADATSEKKTGQFTPHIHRDWHLPGVLPEIDPDVADSLVSKISKGLVIARGLGVLNVEVEYGNSAIVYNSVGKRKTNGVRDVLCQGADWYLATREFERKASLADDALAYWDETLLTMADKMRRPVDSYDESFAFESIVNAEFVTTLLEISTNRIDADQRDKKTAESLKAWAQLVGEIVEKYRGDLGIVGRNQEAERLVEGTRHASLELIGKHVGSETHRALEMAFGQAMDAYYASRGTA